MTLSGNCLNTIIQLLVIQLVNIITASLLVMMYQTAPVGGSICLELIETCLPVHQEVMFTLLIFPTQAATFRTTICSRFYRFTCGIGLTKALSGNFLHMGIMLLQIQLVIIRILSLAEMVGLPNIQIMQVIINAQILAAHTIQDRLVAILTRLPLINLGKEKAIILCSLI